MRRNPLLIATLLTVALHGYIAWRLLPPLALSPAQMGLALSLFLISGVLVPAPILTRLNRLPARLSDALAWVGYLAMGAFSGLLVLCLLRDALLILLSAWELL